MSKVRKDSAIDCPCDDVDEGEEYHFNRGAERPHGRDRGEDKAEEVLVKCPCATHSRLCIEEGPLIAYASRRAPFVSPAH